MITRESEIYDPPIIVGPREHVSVRHTLVSLRSSTVEIATLADVLYDDRARSKAQ